MVLVKIVYLNRETLKLKIIAIVHYGCEATP